MIAEPSPAGIIVGKVVRHLDGDEIAGRRCGHHIFGRVGAGMY
ncbi:hypothetical protein [Candidatus Aeolococcus gillhamiae]